MVGKAPKMRRKDKQTKNKNKKGKSKSKAGGRQKGRQGGPKGRTGWCARRRHVGHEFGALGDGSGENFEELAVGECCLELGVP